MAEILWVQDDFAGPMNGLALYEGKKVWFQRIATPVAEKEEKPFEPEDKQSKKSSSKEDEAKKSDDIDDFEIPDEESDDEGPSVIEAYQFQLLSLSPITLETLQSDHEKKCAITGAPLKHGDPHIRHATKKVDKISKDEFKSLIPEGKDEVSVLGKGMSGGDSFTFSTIEFGEVLATIKVSDFSNYLVPHRVVYQ
jgi:hypothetical protein